MIFGINTTNDISKLLYVISRAVRRVKFETILKYHKWYLCQISLQIMLLFVYTTTHKRFVIFTCRYFKLSWNITALSQSNCRNFSCSSTNSGTHYNESFNVIWRGLESHLWQMANSNNSATWPSCPATFCLHFLI